MSGVPNEQKPVPLVPDTYHPQLGVLYAVKTHESWGSIAQAVGIDVWDLIDFNFPGTKRLMQRNRELATRQVNWYLREYVGCNLSNDGDNWAFTSGLTGGRGPWKGGFIFVPAMRRAPFPVPGPTFPLTPAPAPPPTPAPVPAAPPQKGSKWFRIRQMGAGSYGAGTLGKIGKVSKLPKVGVAVDVMFFQIQDTYNMEQASYMYVGAGAGLGLKSVSATFVGPWNKFTTSARVELDQFEGVARFTSGGGLWWTWNYLHILGTPSGVKSVYIDMDTGFTWGAGASTTAGDLLYNGPVPYTP